MINLQNEVDMLNGNITIICISNEIDEIEAMRKWAIKRINRIADYRIVEIEEE